MPLKCQVKLELSNTHQVQLFLKVFILFLLVAFQVFVLLFISSLCFFQIFYSIDLNGVNIRLFL